MPTTLSPTDIANLALSRIGGQAITSLLDQTSQAALICNTSFTADYLEVSRSGRWNCLLTTAVLTAIPQTLLPWAVGSNSTITATPWAQKTYYAANAYVTYGGYYYQVNYNYTSSVNFTNDLTANALTQTDQNTWNPNYLAADGAQYASGWGFQFALPADFQLLAVLNENACWDFDGAGGDDYEIMGSSLFCNCQNAVIQYVKNQPDTTQFDSLFTNCLAYKLAASISTALRSDEGKFQMEMLELYEKYLRKARAKNGGEQQAIRFNPIRSSRFNQSRYGGVNG